MGERLLRPEVSLLTLTGPGGVGKTRLAQQVASDLAAAFPGGSVFVSLAEIRDPAWVLDEIARVIGARGGPHAILDVIADALPNAPTLLVLDNFEHVLPAADAIGRLLDRCPQLTLLVTSRAPLRLRAEWDYHISPLALTGESADDASAAARLFSARAQAVVSDFALSAGTVPVVDEICRRLDGLPLAIELAAARVKMLPPAALLARLEPRLPMLAGGPADAPPRQRTMRDALAWSYDLLAAQERRLFRWLGVCVGGFDLETAEAVGSALGIDTLEGVGTLVAHSLLGPAGAPAGRARFAMLETVREFALERLEAAAEVEAARRLHARHFLDMVERLDAAVVPYLPDGLRVLERLDADQPNLRAALAHFEARDELEPFLLLAGYLNYYWLIRGQLREGQDWLARAVAVADAAPERARAWALFGMAAMRNLQGDVEQALTICEQSLRLAQAAGDLPLAALASQRCGIFAGRLGQAERAAAFQEDALARLARLEPRPWVALDTSSVLGHLGNVAVASGALAAARAHFAEALQRQSTAGGARGTSHPFASHPLAGLGDVARAEGDLPAALRWYQESLSQAWRFGDVRAAVFALAGIAGTLATADHWPLAARLFGAAEAWCERSGIAFAVEVMDRQRALGLPEPWQQASEPFRENARLRAVMAKSGAVARSLPDVDAAARMWTEGRSLSAEGAVAEALGIDLSALPARQRTLLVSPAGVSFGLTFREQEILALLCQRQTDGEIAERLFLSRRTVESHVSHILQKLDVPNRRAAAAAAIRLGLV